MSISRLFYPQFTRRDFRDQVLLVVIVLSIAGIGTYLLLSSKAAAPFGSTTADQGVVSGCASTQADSTASHSQKVVFGSCGGGGTTGTTRYISTTGNDSGTCTQAAPCASFNYAYDKASLGDTVQVAGGTYGGQVINPDSSKPADGIPNPDATPDVTFEPAPGATVTINGQVFIYGSHVTLLGAVTNSASVPPVTNFSTQSVTIGNNDQTQGRPDADDVTLQNLTGRNFEIDSATDVTVEGGSWGPASSCGGPYGGNNNSIRQPTGTPKNILIDNVVIHDIQSYQLADLPGKPGCHIEGLAIFAGDGVTVSNSKFYGNSVYDIFMQANSGGSPTNITVKNNWLAQSIDESGANGQPVGSADGIAVGSELSANLTYDGNRFNGILNINDDGSISKYTNVNVLNNYGSMSYVTYPCNSLSGVVWSNNVWTTGVKCGPTDTALGSVTNNTSGTLPFLNHNNDSTMNYTITGN